MATSIKKYREIPMYIRVLEILDEFKDEIVTFRDLIMKVQTSYSRLSLTRPSEFHDKVRDALSRLIKNGFVNEHEMPRDEAEFIGYVPHFKIDPIIGHLLLEQVDMLLGEDPSCLHIIE